MSTARWARFGFRRQAQRAGTRFNALVIYKPLVSFSKENIVDNSYITNGTQ